MTSIECHSCGSRLKSKSDFSGKTISCPKCQARIEVPSLDARVATKEPPPAFVPPTPVLSLTQDIRPKPDKHAKICRNCGFVGRPKTYINGNIFTEICLWIFMVLPGVIYTLWRILSKHKGCSGCGSKELIPVDSPVGRKLRKEFYPDV